MNNSREEYIKQKKYFKKDDCPFCTNLSKEQIIYESNFWIVIHNKYPYFGDKNGLIVFPKKHKEFSIELAEEELKDYINIEKFMIEFYKGKEYFSFIRQSKSNKSVEHMHYHYVVGIPHAKIINGEKFLKIQ